MSTTAKSVIFLTLAFAISWAIAIGGHYSGLQQSLGPLGPTLLLTGMMTGPGIAALVCAAAFERGRRVAALGLHFKLNVWWALAWLIPIALAAASVAATLLLSDRSYVDMGQAVRQTAEAQGQDLSQAPAFLLQTPAIVFMAAVLGALFNWPVLTFTEELGWRGYLHHLWRPAGFWRATLGTGLVWGVWHAPAIYLYGLNYPDNALAGMGLFILFCMMLAPLLTLVRDRAGSVWAAGLFHGTFNAVGGLTLGMISDPTFPWNGAVGAGGFIALGAALLLVALSQARAGPVSASP